MFEAKLYQEAEQIIAAAKSIQVTSPLLHIEGKICGVKQKNSEAITLFEQAIAQNFTLDLALDLANVCIVNSDYEKALHYISQAELREQHHQLLLAYKSTCWRLQGDERFQWLVDYDKFVKRYQISNT